MAEQLLINVQEFETRVALLSGGHAQELHILRSENDSLTGNLYIGRVERIVPGMQAAFVNVGLKRLGFLHAKDIGHSKIILADIDAKHESEPGREAAADIRKLIHEGQDILVQITKDPISTKGARLTTNVAIASRYAVLMPFSDHVGISVRIDDEDERERLRLEIEKQKELQAPKMGFIARTAAEGAQAQAIETDIAMLLRIWDKVLHKRGGITAPNMVYQELPVHIRVVRDWTGPNLQTVLIDHQPTYRRVKEFVEEFLPEFSQQVCFDEDRQPLFSRFRIEEDISRALEKNVPLKCGGYLVIEQTEAMISIDVNTGGYVGGQNLEETVFRTNMDAAQIVPKQLRLRNLGGIVVVDFIDMEDAEHQRQVLRSLERALDQDPARTRFEGFSSLGLVQISRKRTRESLVQQLCQPCETCSGDGLVPTAQTTCIEVFRAILQDAAMRCADANPARIDGDYIIRATESVVDRLLDPDSRHLQQVSEQIDRQIQIQVEPSFKPGQFDVVLMHGPSD